MAATLAATLSIMFNAFAAMVKIFLISAVGIFLAKTPREEPLLPVLMIKYLSKLTNNVFVPCLIITSLGSAVTLQLLSRIGVLVFFCFIANSISYFFGHTVGRFLHGRSDDAMFTALVVAIGSPNAISLPIMVMQTMCEEKYVKADYNDDRSECFIEATSMLFVYSMGWHLMFWSYGFPKLKALKQRFYSDLPDLGTDIVHDNTIVEESGNRILNFILRQISFRKNKDALCNWLKTIFLTPAMIAIFIGIAIGLIPFAQELMFERMSFLRPLGSAITTLGEPVVAVNCLIMSASLAQVDFSNGRKKAAPEETAPEVDELEIRGRNCISASDREPGISECDGVDENGTSLKSIKSFVSDKISVFNILNTRKAEYTALLVDEDITVTGSLSIDRNGLNHTTSDEAPCDINCTRLEITDQNSAIELGRIKDLEALCDHSEITDYSKVAPCSFVTDVSHYTETGTRSSLSHIASIQPPGNSSIDNISREKFRMKIPPPTYRSIFALIICRCVLVRINNYLMDFFIITKYAMRVFHYNSSLILFNNLYLG